eukprot:CAMPEP_0114610416 /NCGR_PEP_ID=MMETSP0168-20121206/3590_1 /TAXON_ID=95228 ORGANISM="Vannella sp., Strain DIVA3 517/6/12" /NCGR_SAMPLE_ID=MMETSP0168 /ASSEMBLY_ACC=CAM_ASM_000044 /LENGTH=122 /DNA_ID=CAMNT_0001821359 /DNA_START=13 /DNA_END=378 /DNA_ORIENTATION=+
MEEDASTLEFGVDFENTKCLSNSEVALILDISKQEDDVGMTPMYDQTLKYVQRFNKFKSKAMLQEVRNKLESRNLHAFEVACLANLVPDDLEEAKELIPSLSTRLDDDEIDAILKELHQIQD